MHSKGMVSAHVVDLIHMPGRDGLSEVDLLDHPWFVHELGHYTWLQHDPPISDHFKKEELFQQASRKFRPVSVGKSRGCDFHQLRTKTAFARF
jgi:hypothetical protein